MNEKQPISPELAAGVSAKQEKQNEAEAKGDRATKKIHDLIDALQQGERDGRNPSGIAVEFAEPAEDRLKKHPLEWVDDSIAFEVVRDGKIVGIMEARRAERENLLGSNFIDVRYTDAETREVVGAGRQENLRTGEVSYSFSGEGYKPDDAMTDDDVARAESRYVDLTEDLLGAAKSSFEDTSSRDSA